MKVRGSATFMLTVMGALLSMSELSAVPAELTALRSPLLMERGVVPETPSMGVLVFVDADHKEWAQEAVDFLKECGADVARMKVCSLVKGDGVKDKAAHHLAETLALGTTPCFYVYGVGAPLVEKIAPFSLKKGEKSLSSDQKEKLKSAWDQVPERFKNQAEAWKKIGVLPKGDQVDISDDQAESLWAFLSLLPAEYIPVYMSDEIALLEKSIYALSHEEVGQQTLAWKKMFRDWLSGAKQRDFIYQWLLRKESGLENDIEIIDKELLVAQKDGLERYDAFLRLYYRIPTLVKLAKAAQSQKPKGVFSAEADRYYREMLTDIRIVSKFSDDPAMANQAQELSRQLSAERRKL